MLRTYESFSYLFPQKKKKTKKETSHVKLGAEVYANITQIKKAFEMLLISSDLDTSSPK